MKRNPAANDPAPVMWPPRAMLYLMHAQRLINEVYDVLKNNKPVYATGSEPKLTSAIAELQKARFLMRKYAKL